MALTTISLYLQQNLAPNPISDPNDLLVQNFLIELQQSRKISEIRLFFCLAIDVKSSIRKFGTVNKNINTVVSSIYKCIIESYNIPIKITKTFEDGLPPQLRFSIAQKNISPSSYLPCVSCSGQHSYSRVSSFQSYLRYVVKPNLTPSTAKDLPEDIDDTSLGRYLIAFLNDTKFREIKVTRLGRTGSWVFVTDYTELELTNYKHQNKAEEIVDGLGFYITNVSMDEYYVCLRYEDNFDERVYQPDVLTGDWGRIEDSIGNEFFLSHPMNAREWGQTQSVSGMRPSFRERVHQSFDHEEKKYYTFSTDTLGTIESSMGKGNMASLIMEAVTRFQNA